MKKTLQKIKRNLARRTPFIVTAALIVVIGGVVLGSTAAYAQLTSTRTIPASERYTELSFNNHLGLPTAATGTEQDIQFHVRNDEGKSVTYHYLFVATSQSGATTVLKEGVLTLADGKSADVNAAFTLPLATKLTRLSVLLTDQKQEIHFWVGAK